MHDSMHLLKSTQPYITNVSMHKRKKSKQDFKDLLMESRLGEISLTVINAGFHCTNTANKGAGLKATLENGILTGDCKG